MKPCSLPPHASPIFLSGPPYLYRESRRGLPLAGLSTRVSPYHLATKFQLLGTIGLTEACQVMRH
jgi:hypothetical protein